MLRGDNAPGQEQPLSHTSPRKAMLCWGPAYIGGQAWERGGQGELHPEGQRLQLS